jgi:pyruvate,orthophosphate dikinase
MSEVKSYVFSFGDGKADGNAKMKPTLGGKGANLAEMTLLGIPVPPGLTISTDACREFYALDRTMPKGLDGQVHEGIARVEAIMGQRFGDPANPLLFSVRSGGAVSMPGMMDTVLNLGLNKATVEGLAKFSGNRRFALDSYRRFIQMYGEVVLGIRADSFENLLEGIKHREGIREDYNLREELLDELVERYLDTVWRATGRPFPEDPFEQLWGSVGAVFRSWNNKRAREYRDLYKIPHDIGTAVTVQTMVYGNKGDDCATGVAFTRNPSTGEPRFFGEFLINAQGEDVVAGIRTPRPIMAEDRAEWDEPSLEETMPEVYDQLIRVCDRLERHFRDVQDIEFTVEQGKLWLLQTRTGKRTAGAAVRIAVDMVTEGLIDEATAVKRIEPAQLDQLLHPSFDPEAKTAAQSEGRAVLRGLPASPGAVWGHVAFTPEEAVEMATRGVPVILMRNETSPEDIQGMSRAQGIVTARGGMTSHAAVVARGMGKCCVVGCTGLRVDEKADIASYGAGKIKAGDVVSIDGSTGEVFVGRIDTVEPELGEHFGTLMGWADGFRRLRVRTNADTPRDSRMARSFGAEGIGLCRTEHMFFSPERITAVREMILAADEAGRRAALAKIRPMQRGDFKQIFKEMEGFPVTIRLLDPPLHEFLPSSEDEVQGIAKETGVSAEDVWAKIGSLREVNPMLGHRGCRLGITFPEIYEMQVEAIMEAACELARDDAMTIVPEIMIPLVAHARELELLREVCSNAADRTMAEMGVQLDYLIGTMIELPRAAITADEIAVFADFFSFGTNDLTQTTFGLSRDDAGSFLPLYVDMGILEADPFAVLDSGVAKLVELGARGGRSVKPNLKIGICGEHGGEPRAVATCHTLGLDYVSCSPFRVPIARLAAAHAALDDKSPHA